MAYTRGSGPDQLPQGGATTANSDVPAPEQGPDLVPQDIPVEYATTPPQDVGAMDKRDSENSQLLTNPADPNYRPDPGSRGVGRLPTYVIRNLPLLAAAARDPEAPRSIKALYRAVLARAEAEQTENP